MRIFVPGAAAASIRPARYTWPMPECPVCRREFDARFHVFAPPRRRVVRHGRLRPTRGERAPAPRRSSRPPSCRRSSCSRLGRPTAAAAGHAVRFPAPTRRSVRHAPRRVARSRRGGPEPCRCRHGDVARSLVPRCRTAAGLCRTAAPAISSALPLVRWLGRLRAPRRRRRDQTLRAARAWRADQRIRGALLRQRRPRLHRARHPARGILTIATAPPAPAFRATARPSGPNPSLNATHSRRLPTRSRHLPPAAVSAGTPVRPDPPRRRTPPPPPARHGDRRLRRPGTASAPAPTVLRPPAPRPPLRRRLTPAASSGRRSKARKNEKKERSKPRTPGPPLAFRPLRNRVETAEGASEPLQATARRSCRPAPSAETEPSRRPTPSDSASKGRQGAKRRQGQRGTNKGNGKGKGKRQRP